MQFIVNAYKILLNIKPIVESLMIDGGTYEVHSNWRIDVKIITT